MVELLVNVDVDDLERGIEFYRRALGLRLGRRFGTFGAELLGGSSALYLLAKPSGSLPAAGATGARDYRRHWTPVHLDIVVDDIEDAARRAEAAGALPEGGIERHVWGRIAQFADPFGHGFCLLQFDGRGYDAIATAGG